MPKLSDIIEKLQELQNENGDMEVHVIGVHNSEPTKPRGLFICEDNICLMMETD